MFRCVSECVCVRVCPHSFDLRAVSQLLDGVAVLGVVLQQDGHLEGGGLQRVPETSRPSVPDLQGCL